MKEAFVDIRKQLEKKLKKDRFEHTIGVMYTAASLAMRYHEDIDDAMMAGLLHDCGSMVLCRNRLRDVKNTVFCLHNQNLRCLHWFIETGSIFRRERVWCDQ